MYPNYIFVNNIPNVPLVSTYHETQIVDSMKAKKTFAHILAFCDFVFVKCNRIGPEVGEYDLKFSNDVFADIPSELFRFNPHFRFVKIFIFLDYPLKRLKRQTVELQY